MSHEEEAFAAAPIPARNRRMVAGGVAAALVAAGIGYALLSRDGGTEPTGVQSGAVNGVVQDGSGKTVLYWFDPMLPMERYKGPGRSSMNMALQPKYADGGAAGGGVRISPAVQQNLGVRTARVRFEILTAAIAVVGRVETDERQIVEVQTLTPGFVEQLSVRAVGEPVGKGARVASIYAPELLGAQHEYVALLNIRPSTISPGLRNAARQRLQLLGLPDAAVRKLDRGGRPQRTYGVFASRSGIVTQIGARPGARVEPGQSILTLADLSQVWVVAEVPEISLGQIRIGQPVQISFPAYGSEPVAGRIDYIFPSLNADTRTARVRVTLPNPGGRLKIGMFANVTIGGVANGGLVVPAEAVISTGRRNVVIVQRKGGFVPVEVDLGRTVGDRTEIKRGLNPDDIVVVSGQFLIDSEASLTGLLDRLSRGRSPAAQQPPQDGLIQGRGIVKTVEAASDRITLDHEPLAAINWPAMTMTFPVKDGSLLRGRKPGDRVTFAFQRPGQGQVPVIERIAPAAAR